MNTSEVLNKAADLIEQRGWDQGDGWNEGADRTLCLEGGIQAALGHKGLGERDLTVACPAYRAVQEYLGLNDPALAGLSRRHLWWWNDDEGRTKEEVIEVLRAAALVEAAKESAVEVSVE